MTPPSPTTQPTDPDVRMLTSLLATCDPLGAIAAGGEPSVYADTARDVLLTLDAGADVTDVLLTLPEADVEPAFRFASVALHWWSNRVIAIERRMAGSLPA